MTQIPLNAVHVGHLIAFCGLYRSFLWQYILPSPERNQALRLVQAIQGKLTALQQNVGIPAPSTPPNVPGAMAPRPNAPSLLLALTFDEGRILQNVFVTLWGSYQKTLESAERTRLLGQIKELRSAIAPYLPLNLTGDLSTHTLP